MPDLVSADEIAAQAGRFEPQRTNNFSVAFTPPGASEGESKVIRMTLLTFPMPEETTESITIEYGNEKRYVAGKTEFGESNLVVNDYVDARVAEILNAWRRKVYDPETGVVGLARDYKIEGTVEMFGPGADKVADSFMRTWTVIGMWPTSINFGEGNMDGNNQNTVEMTMRADKIIFNGWSS